MSFFDKNSTGRKFYSSPYFIYAASLLSLVAVSYLSLFHGGPVSLDDPDTASVILKEIRYPKLMVSILAGGSLSLAGFVFQSVLRNPLADPYILGVSSGAALGTSFYVMLVGGIFGLLGAKFSSFTGALLAVGLLMSIYRLMSRNSSAMILAGVGISLFFSSIITFIISNVEGSRLLYLSSWLIGTVSSPEPGELYFLFFILLAGFIILYLFADALDVIRFGDDFAASSGVNVSRYTALFIITASLLTAGTVSVCGTLGFIGLVVPHITRLIMNTRTKVLLPAVFIFGSTFLTLCTFLAGFFSTGFDIPAGAVSSFIGAPVLLYLLYRRYHAKGV